MPTRRCQLPTSNHQLPIGPSTQRIAPSCPWQLGIGECLGRWELEVGSSRLPGRSSGAGRVDVILPGSCGSCGPCRAARSRRRRPPYGACSSGVERWTVAPEAAGSKPVTHPSTFVRPASHGRPIAALWACGLLLAALGAPRRPHAGGLPSSCADSVYTPREAWAQRRRRQPFERGALFNRGVQPRLAFRAGLHSLSFGVIAVFRAAP